ncbi:MAG: hypothetical protein AB3N21_13775 [Ruegeria sp.]|uniref:hypothetical protein n=1 Tax=Ruegeria sp. TaxID=1879320 RepID=UPI00349E56F8
MAIQNTLRHFLCAVLTTMIAQPGFAESSLGQSALLRTADGGEVAAEVDRQNPDYLEVSLDGYIYSIIVREEKNSSVSEVRDDSGALLLAVTRSDEGMTVTDQKGSSIRSDDGVISRFAASQLFEPIPLLLLDAENLRRLRAAPKAFEPGLTIGMLEPTDSLCCDKGTVSNCFPPDDEGNCTGGKVVHECPNDGDICEINGTWNCC